MANIKVFIPEGATAAVAIGLHQWDYGRLLEIHDATLPAATEVHFACVGMDEAQVRTGSLSDGVLTVPIPDGCLEQSTPITAWVYEDDGRSGKTTKTITLPLLPRPKPSDVVSLASVREILREDVPNGSEDELSVYLAALNAALCSQEGVDIAPASPQGFHDRVLALPSVGFVIDLEQQHADEINALNARHTAEIVEIINNALNTPV
jgi:hypothetical protein